MGDKRGSHTPVCLQVNLRYACDSTKQSFEQVVLVSVAKKRWLLVCQSKQHKRNYLTQLAQTLSVHRPGLGQETRSPPPPVL